MSATNWNELEHKINNLLQLLELTMLENQALNKKLLDYNQERAHFIHKNGEIAEKIKKIIDIFKNTPSEKE